MAVYTENGIKVISGILAQVSTSTSGAYTAFYTVGGGANNNGINTPAARGARGILVTITNDSAIATDFYLSHASLGEAAESAHILRSAFTLAARETTEVYIPGMQKTDILRYFLANAGTWRGETAREVKAEIKRRLK